MIFNGELSSTPESVLYTVPSPTPGLPRSGNNAGVNLFRVVNETGSQIKFNLYLNVNGSNRRIIPVDTILEAGCAFDDLPEFQLPPGAQIRGDSDTAGVSWTINVILL